MHHVNPPGLMLVRTNGIIRWTGTHTINHLVTYGYTCSSIYDDNLDELLEITPSGALKIAQSDPTSGQSRRDFPRHTAGVLLTRFRRIWRMTSMLARRMMFWASRFACCTRCRSCNFAIRTQHFEGIYDALRYVSGRLAKTFGIGTIFHHGCNAYGYFSSHPVRTPVCPFRASFPRS